jgi:hypothetical protein
MHISKKKTEISLLRMHTTHPSYEYLFHVVGNRYAYLQFLVCGMLLHRKNIGSFRYSYPRQAGAQLAAADLERAFIRIRRPI